MVGRAGGYALLGSIPLVLVWLIMCRLAPTLLIITTNLVVIASSVVTAVVLFTNPSGWSLTDSEAMVIAACRLCAHACNPMRTHACHSTHAHTPAIPACHPHLHAHLPFLPLPATSTTLTCHPHLPT